MTKEELLKSVTSVVENAVDRGEINTDMLQVFLLIEILTGLEEVAASLKADDEREER